MSNKTLKPVVLAASAVMLGSIALSGPAFAMTPLAQGYLLAASVGDDKPTEGSCGADHAGDAAATDADGKPKEGSCGEGRCGEGQCGADKPEAAATPTAGEAAADAKAADGTCGEGQCGGDHGDGAAATDDKADGEGTCNG